MHLFRRLAPEEIPPTVNGIRGSDALLVIVAESLDEGTSEAARLLLPALRQEGARLLRETEVKTAELRGRDILFLGLPRRPDLLPAVPPNLQLQPYGFSLGGKTYRGADTALFAALPHPTDPGRVSGLFLPFSAEAARDAARRIPHYGRYSYLVFVGGVNRERGTWEVETAPTIHQFAKAP